LKEVNSVRIPDLKKNLSVVRVPTAILAAVLLCATCCFGQRTRSELVGTVTDSSGAAVPRADVTITNTKTGVTQTTKTSDIGEYRFPELIPGTYTLRVESQGFKTQNVQPFQLYIDQTARQDVTLAVGAQNETITVSASAAVAVLDTENATQGQVIQNKQIVDLPLNGRNFMDLAPLSTGVTPIMAGMNTAATFWGGGGTAGTGAVSLSIAGTREDDVSYLLEGIETRNNWFGAVGIKPSVEAIQEFKVQETGSSAAYGYGAAFVNTTLKSGTNRLHWTAYEFLRNNALDARNFFDIGPPPPFRQNQFGGNVGGPVVKDKAFFFVNYEGFRQSRPAPWYTLVPTPAQKQGDFSALTTPLVNPFTGEPVADNIISSTLFSAPGVKALGYYPEPNGTYPGGLNYFTVRSTTNDANQVNARGDYYLNRNNITGSFTLADLTSVRPGLVDVGNASFPLHNRSASVGWVHTFTPAMLNDFRLGWSRTDSGEIRAHGYDTSFANPLGLANSANTPGQYGLPDIGLTGYGSPSPGVGTNLIHDNIFMLTDSILFQHGKQAIRVGGDIRFEPMYMYENWAHPWLDFNGSYSGEPVADLLFGVFDSAGTAIGDPTLHWRKWYQAYYVQDDIKVTPRLSLNLGLRWEYAQPPVDTRNHVGTFDFETGDVVSYPDTSSLGLGRNMVFPDHNNVAPRFGLAWRPFGEKTVVRAGYGVYYLVSNMNQNEQEVDGPKYYLDYTYTNSPAGVIPPQYITEQLYNVTGTAFGLIGFVNPTNRTGYAHEWSLTIQRTLGHNWLLEVGTLGSAAHKTALRININTPLSAGVYPYENYQGGNSETRNGGNSIYNALTSRLERRFSSGLSVLGSYTWSKCLDYGWTDEFAPRPYDIRSQRGHCTYDITQRMAGNAVYELPFGRGKAFLNSGGVTNAALGGWQVSTIAQFSTGAWVNAVGAQNIAVFDTAFPNVIGPPNNPSLRGSIREHNLYPYFNVSSFEPITTLCCGMAVQGNAGRNIIQMPGINNWDLSLFKTWRIGEQFSLAFRSDFFNAFNHAQFNGLQTAVYAPNFGYVTSAGPGREIQFSLRLSY
jgi:hypothetical protein